MGSYDRLFTLWRDPVDGTRHVVGELWREGGAYLFAYEPQLDGATARGFQLLSEFPELRSPERPYRAEYLFSTFAQRIPEPRRADRARILASWGVENPDDLMEILARSGGVQVTDRIELGEYRAASDDLTRPLEFRVAGTRHRDGADQLALRPGDTIVLRRESENPHDPNATLVCCHGDTPIGYVPRQYSAMVARLLDAGVVVDGALVRKLLLPAEAGRWVVRLARRSG